MGKSRMDLWRYIRSCNIVKTINHWWRKCAGNQQMAAWLPYLYRNVRSQTPEDRMSGLHC